jgi:antitoxin component of MazEF toxin-antitoxin module
MKTRLIKIGKSLGVRLPKAIGVRLPKAIIKKAGLKDDVELAVEGQTIVIRSAKPRAGWAESCRLMHEHGDDKPLWPEHALTAFDDEEWEW